MLIKRISIYQEFHCIGADCPVSCCRGWKIPINHEIYLKYLHQKGLFGAVLKLLMIKKEDLVSFRNSLKRCPFWGLDHLCTIQKKYGTDYMPLVCVQFPRQLYHLDFFCEETLYLACPEAARLFLKSVEENQPFLFEETTGEVHYPVHTTNDDEAFLNYLVKSRTELIELLYQGFDFDYTAIQHYGRDAQNACLSKLPLPSPLDYLSETQEYILFDCTLLNYLFLNGFYHPMLKKSSLLLFKLCKKYINNICNLHERNPKAAEKKRSELIRTFQNKVPNSDRLLNRYFEYYLQTNFLDIFEDYSFSKHLFLGAAKTAMLQIFIGLYAEDKKMVTNEELSTIIAVFERRSPQIEDAIKISLPSSTRIRSVTGPRITPPIP